MKSHPVAGLIAAIVLAGCQKSDPAPAGVASATAAQTALPSLKDFEGEVDVLVKSAREPRPIPPIAIFVKATKLRFDLPEGMERGPKFGGKAYVVVNTTEKKLYAVIDQQKQVVVMDLANLGQQMKEWNPAQPSDAPSAPPKITKTGHTDTVAGYSCEDWDIVSAKGEHSRVCVADQSTSWFQLPGINLPSEHTWAKELFDGQHLPLRMVGYDAAGGEDSRVEVEKLEKKPVADSVFDIPTTYRTMDLAEIMKALMGGMGGMMAGLQPGAMPSGLPPGFPAGMQLPPGVQLPPGMQLPPGVTLPPGMKLPPGAQIPPGAAEMLRQMQERARAAQMPTPPPAAK